METTQVGVWTWIRRGEKIEKNKKDKKDRKEAEHEKEATECLPRKYMWGRGWEEGKRCRAA